MRRPSYNETRRAVDIAVSVIGLAATAPFIGVAALLIKLEDGGPIVFQQERVGLRTDTFRIYKLRTMSVGQSAGGQTYDRSPGVTNVGRVLRRLKMDEVPQLLNVLRGEMSLIGPRPCLPSSVPEMPEWAFERFDVRPGLTGLAQVKGNAMIPWPERWKFDVAYVHQVSPRLDARIFVKTLETLILGEGRVADRGAR